MILLLKKLGLLLLALCPFFLVNAEPLEEIVYKNFYYTGGVQTWVVPDYISLVNLEVCGAKSARGYEGFSFGELVKGDFVLSAGQKLFFVVGQPGSFDLWDLSASHGGSSFVFLDNGDGEFGKGDKPLISARGGDGYFFNQSGKVPLGAVRLEETLGYNFLSRDQKFLLQESFNFGSYQEFFRGYSGEGRITIRLVEYPGQGIDNLTVSYSGEQLISSVDWTYGGFQDKDLRHYKIYIGTQPGRANIYHSEIFTGEEVAYGPRCRFFTPPLYPKDGTTLYVRLYYFTWRWEFEDTAFIYYSNEKLAVPRFLNLHSGDIVSGKTFELNWKPNGAVLFKIYMGKEPGGMDYYQSGVLQRPVEVEKALNSHVLPLLPANNSQVHLRFWYYLPGKNWEKIDVEFQSIP